MVGRAQLILVLGLGVILGALSLNMAGWTRSSSHNSAYFFESMTSHNLAQAGAQAGINKVIHDTSWYGSASYVENSSGGSYVISRTSTNPLLVQSVSTYSGTGDVMHDTIDVFLASPTFTSFTLFSWMTNGEGGCQWVTGDSVMGRLHSNGSIAVNGKPVFMDKVTTVHQFTPPPGQGTDRAIFAKGFETGVDSVYFPDNLQSVLDSAKTAGGRFYNVHSVWVTLAGGNPAVAGDGTALVRTSQGGAVLDTVHIGQTGFNGVIMGLDSVHVQGTLDGQVTIGSSTGNVYVEDNLLYERDPRSVPASKDLLGLVADQSVIIADNTANRTDCVIDGNIFARAGSLTAQNCTDGTLRGRLSILGSIVQNIRGAVGSNLNGVVNSGYYKSYAYDSRLFDPSVRPPMYPGYIPPPGMVVGWWESMHMPNFSSYE